MIRPAYSLKTWSGNMAASGKAASLNPTMETLGTLMHKAKRNYTLGGPDIGGGNLREEVLEGCS